MREVLYLPWGKKKSNQRKIEIKFNNLFGKKKNKNLSALKPTKLWWMKTDILTDQKPTAAKNAGLFKNEERSWKKTHAAVLRMIAIKFNNRRILLLNWHFFKKQTL